MIDYEIQQIIKETTRSVKMLNNVIRLILILIAVYCVILVANKCEAQNNTALALAQCVISEHNHDDDNMKEVIATAYVLYKRMNQYNNNKYNKRKRSFYEQIIIYCAVFNKGAAKNYNGPKQIERRRKILASTFEKPVYLDNKVTIEYWKELERFTEILVVSIELFDDPCPNSMHFGGSMDVPKMSKQGWIIDKQCSELTNKFFRKK